MKSFCVHVMAYMVLLIFAGCVQMDLSSAADCDENSKMQFCDVTSAYWWDWGDSAQKMLDDRLQGAEGRVGERAVPRLSRRGFPASIRMLVADIQRMNVSCLILRSTG